MTAPDLRSTNTGTSLKFDPYESRLARQIRNRLSTAFVRAVETGEFAELEKEAEYVCPTGSDPAARDFACNRMERYRHAFDRIRAEGIADPIRRAAYLWNEGLFFEVHEILERIWNDEQRWRKEALRGLIQAAGVFVHRERGAHQAAKRLASRAASHLRRHRRNLAEIDNIEELIEALEDPGKAVPELRLRIG
ncbi:MAG: DUF309 domain-containing protein [Desulfobacterales bacterium]|jgi:hypothetical protein